MNRQTPFTHNVIGTFVCLEDEVLTWQFALATELSEMGKKMFIEVVTFLIFLSAIVVNSRFKICSQICNFIEYSLNAKIDTRKNYLCFYNSIAKAILDLIVMLKGIGE